MLANLPSMTPAALTPVLATTAPAAPPSALTPGFAATLGAPYLLSDGGLAWRMRHPD